MHPASDIAGSPAPRIDTPSRDADAVDRPMDAGSFENVWHDHHAAIFSYLASRVGAQNAEDITVATFEAALKARHTFDPSVAAGALRPWLYGIATKQLSRHRALERRWLKHLAAASDHSDADGPDRRLVAIDRQGDLSNALRSLPRAYRDAFLLLVLADLDYADIGRALGVPVGTVRSRVNRARKHLVHELKGTSHE